MFDSAGLEVLVRTECLRLLESKRIGRLVYTDRALPAVLPVAFAVHDGAVVVRAPEGGAAAAVRGAVVAFEVDDVDGDLREGWTVTVVGHATEAGDARVLSALDELNLPVRFPDRPHHYIVIALELVSGRRIPRPAP
ncbi:pyridoxamine 5'-phosphate oxidase family protein [Umezawaea beigongshangensis]|uniref:pyridoxamine 5'-phosphate oxidase family protein n=1 Tax=Umezawaea beigongshangensis TaxID=2780383 RepID=UPI0018F1D570|nr:pyridoxamine 5'-phosphate oxidase family protein [Umezawaea beigongshangensis]